MSRYRADREAAMWDPGQYRRFGDERSRPFFDLVGRADAAPEVVVDRGCGPGPPTAAPARRWRALRADVRLNHQAGDRAEYVALLAGSGFEVDAWEATYLHVLPGDDPVVSWSQGTGMRPVLAALPPDQAAEFLADYRARVTEAYPAAAYGTVFPFRRVFAVAVRR